MGMFCVDEIHTAKDSYTGIIGGAGTYAVLGAGIARSPEGKRKVGFICDKGYDFDPKMFAEISSWGFGVTFREDLTRETTKAWNKFVNNEERLFKYLSPKLQVVASDLGSSGLAKCIHLICSPGRCAEFMEYLKKLELPYQKYVWEPVPTQTAPEDFPSLKKVVETYSVDVLSPNALEAASLVGLAEPVSKREVEDLVAKHYAFAPTVVIRCGALGSYLRTATFKKWYPAYFEGEPHRVVDPSGAGNAFCGGLGAAMVTEEDWDTVMAYSSVGASFMIEQIGAPTYDPSTDLWNGENAAERVRLYRDRITKSV